MVLIVVDDKESISEYILITCFALTILITTIYLGVYLIHRYKGDDKEESAEKEEPKNE
jgi:hypothetical protein